MSHWGQPGAPGAANRRVPPGEHGFTLVEMLVVLAIIGISTAAAVLAMGARQDGSGQAAAQRLRARIQLAADEAMISDRSVALAVTPTGYAVLERSAGAQPWRPTTLGGLDEVTRLPPGMHLSAPGARLADSADGTLLALDADAAGQPFVLALERGTQHWTIDFDGMRANLRSGDADLQRGAH